MSKRVVVTGATGLIGKKLVKELVKRNDEVIVFSRDAEKAKSIFPNVKEFVEWDYRKDELLKTKFENSNAVVHLAGINLFAKRWDVEFKKSVLESRQLSTKNLVDTIKCCNNKPEVFISASGIGYYGDCGDSILTEESSAGKDFLADVCKVWESEARKIEQLGVRSVQIRTGLVLSAEDGALKQMLPAFKLFIGGPLGSGKQWASWLHIDDIVGIYIHSIDCKELSGAVNAASPIPVKMKQFTKTLGQVLNRPSLFPVPKFILRIAVGEAAEVVTASQRIDIKKLLKSGYNFKFTLLDKAFKDLLKIN